MINRKIIICKPNMISIIWILLCLKIITLDVVNRGVVDYIIWGVVCFLIIINQKRILNSEYFKIGRPFIILIFLQILGLTQVCTVFSITSIIATFCVFAFVMVNSQLSSHMQHVYIEVPFLLTFLVVLYNVYKGASLGNTLPGCMIFLAYGFLVCKFDKDNSDQRMRIKWNKNIWKWFVYSITVFGIVYICWISESRTALFTIPIIVLTFFFFPKKGKTFKMLFWCLILACTVVTIIYINIHSFEWYHVINKWSILKFGKQLDSSRPELWRVSINQLKWWQFIVGSGTGRLPSIARYQIASFHNSYIQLLMQNGILGLGCLITVFYRIWEKLCIHKGDMLVRLVLSIFVGIMIYNCFECTLLQNKAFMGLTEWIILCFGLIRVRQLEESY